MTTDILQQFVTVRASLEQQRIQLKAQLKSIKAVLSGEGPAVKVEVHTPAQAKPKMSAAGRDRITAGTKAKWARWRAAKAVSQAVVKPKPIMSAAGRANIIAAQKARWANIKAAKRQTAETKPLPKVKMRISVAGRRRMIEGAKARWAKIKAAKAKAPK